MRTLKKSLLSAFAVIFAFAIAFAVSGIVGNNAASVHATDPETGVTFSSTSTRYFIQSYSAEYYRYVSFEYKFDEGYESKYARFWISTGTSTASASTKYQYKYNKDGVQGTDGGPNGSADDITTESVSDGYRKVTIRLSFNCNDDDSDDINYLSIMVNKGGSAIGVVRNVRFDDYLVSVTDGKIGDSTNKVVASGESVTVVADTAPSGKVFSHWENGSGVKLSGASSYTFTVSGDLSLSAVYTESGVTFSSGTRYFVKSESSQYFRYVSFEYKFDTDNGGESQKFLITKNTSTASADLKYNYTYNKNGNTTSNADITTESVSDGYRKVIIRLSFNCNASDSDDVNYLSIMVNKGSSAGVMRNVRFGDSLVSVSSGEIDGATKRIYVNGATATVEADDAPDGKLFSHWEDGSGANVSTDEEYSFAVSEDVELTAVYADAYTVSVTGGTIGGETSALVIDGGSATVVAGTPASGKYFAYWTNVYGKILSYNPTYTFTVSGDIEVTANYASEDSPKHTFTNGTHLNSSSWLTVTEQTYSTVIFDYYITDNDNSKVISVGILGSSDAQNYYGWTTFSKAGVCNYPAGMTVIPLSDGYYRVIVDTTNASIHRTGSSAISGINYIRIHKSNSTASSAYIRNVQFLNNYTVSVTNGEGSDTYTNGTSVTVVADVDDGYYFRNWTDDSDDSVLSTDSSYTFTVTENISLTANTRAYDGTKYAVGEKVNHDISGSLSDEFTFEYLFEGDTGSAGVCLTNSNTNSIAVQYFTISNGSVGSTSTDGVTITREQLSDGYYKVTVSGAAVATEGMSKIYSNSSHKVANAAVWVRNAQFTEKKLVTVVNGTINGDSSAFVAEGEEATVVANTPASTKYFVGWSDGSSIVSTDEEYTFEVEDDITLTATYADKVSVSATGAASGTGLYAPGESATLVASAPASGKYFAYWTDVNDNIVSFTPSYTFTVSGAVSYTANYADASEYVSYTTGGPSNWSSDEVDNIAYEKIIFDYCITDGESDSFIHVVALYTGSSYYGWYDFTKTGGGAATGITVSALENGYYRVVIDTATASKRNSPAGAYVLQIHRSNSTSGITVYVRNVRFVKNGTITVTNGELHTGAARGTFTGTTSVTVTADDAPPGKVFSCWKDGSGNVLSTDEEYTFKVVGNVSLTAYYATLVTVSASGGTVDGVSSKTLADGSTVTLVANAPAAGYYFLNWTNTAGSEISTSATAEIEIDGATTYTANYLAYTGTKYAKSKSVDIAAPKGEKAYDRVLFDYKIADNDNTVGFCLSNSGSTYFGYFTVKNSGTTSTYDGVSYERLSDGYIRITLDLDDLTEMKGDLDGDSTITGIHFSSSRVGADIYIKNVNFLLANEPFAMYEGASVRLKDPYGIRFRALIPFDKYDEDATYGMIILPYDYITKNSIDLTGDIKAQLDAKSVKYRIYTCVPIEMDTTDYYIQASLTNILESNLTRPFIGIGYSLKSGTYTYVTSASINACKRSIFTVSEITMQHTDVLESYSEDRQAFLRGIVGCDELYSGSSFKVNGFDSLENFKKNDSVSSSSSISLYAAKGESESAQVILTDTASGAMNGVNYVVTVGDLTHSDGVTKIDKAGISVYNAHYVNVTTNATAWLEGYARYSASFPTTGVYADALVPFSAAAVAGDAKFVSTGGYNQTVYVDFAIPEDQKAGVYTGNIRIDVIGYGYKLVAVTFTVKDIVLPEENHARTIFEIESENLNAIQGLEGRAENDSEDYVELYDFLLDYGVNAGFLPQKQYHSNLDWDGYLETLVSYYNDPRVTTIKLDMDRAYAYYSYGGTTHDNILVVLEYDRNMNGGNTKYGSRTIFKKLAEYCVENDVNLFTKIVVRYDDEPDNAKEYCQTILSYNAVKRGIEYAAYNAGINWTGHEDIRGSLLDVPYLVTAAPVSQLIEGNTTVNASATAYYKTDSNNALNQDITITYKYLTDYVPYYKYFTNDDGAVNSEYANILYTISDGDYTYWWYGCVQPSPPYQNYSINSSMVRTRANRWAQFGTGIEGELYWGVNFWGVRSSSVTTLKEEDYIWESGSVYENSYGDGMLVYPNFHTYEGAGKYIPTLRLYALRESIEDYNLLYYAQSLIDDMVSGSKKTTYQSTLTSILAKLYNQNDSKSGICDTRSITTSAATFRTARSDLYTLIAAILGDSVYEEQDIDSEVLVLSDVHVFSNSDRQAQLTDALEYARDNGVSAVVINGDMVEKGTQANWDILDGIFEDVFTSPSAEGIPEFVFNMGNHEFYLENDADYTYSTQFNLYKAFAEKWSRNTISDNVYARQINGVYYVVAIPSDNEPGDTHKASSGYYTASDISKIGAIFDDILSDGTYNKPIILLTHWMIGATYGADYDVLPAKYVSRFTTLLADYPMVIHVTGHSHFSALHDRALDQGNYTTINVGQFAYDYFVSGLEKDENSNTLTYDNVIAALRADGDLDPEADGLDRNKYFGLIFGYTSDNLFIRRVDLKDEQIETRGWTIPYGITKSNKSSKFYYEDGERVGTDLHFGVDTALTGYKNSSNGNLIMVSFRDVEEYRECEGYKLVVKNGSGTTLKTVYWMSRFWAGLDEKSEYYIPLSGVTGGTYKLELYAINHFGEYSDLFNDYRIVNDSKVTKEMFVDGVNYTWSDSSAAANSELSFDYKVLNGGEFDLCILDGNGSNYYGYFTFTEDGEKSDYAGVSCTAPDSDGWITVTITFEDVTVHSTTVPSDTKTIRIRGRSSNATGWIYGPLFG